MRLRPHLRGHYLVGDAAAVMVLPATPAFKKPRRVTANHLSRTVTGRATKSMPKQSQHVQATGYGKLCFFFVRSDSPLCSTPLLNTNLLLSLYQIVYRRGTHDRTLLRNWMWCR